jgi:F-type H+-transporting ATPase subunit b
MILAQTGSENPLFVSPRELIPELIVCYIAFFVIFGVLAKILLPRFTQMLQDRTDAIEGGQERAEQGQEEANELLEQYRAQLAEARHEAARLREQAREQGAQVIAEMREQAQAEARRITEAAAAQLEADRQQALAVLRAEVGALSMELAGRIVGEPMPAELGSVADQFLADLESQPAAQPGRSPSRPGTRA